MNQVRGPDFLCIGAPKTGTTWLYKQLSAHPQIWLPPVKELRYFERRFPLPKWGEKLGRRRGLAGFFRRHDTRNIVRLIARSALRGSPSELRWAFRYLSAEDSDEWYLSLFAPARDRICGELTTDYCALSIEAVRFVRALLPGVRIVFLMRNPIERAWSHAKMLLPELLGRPLKRISAQELLDYTLHPIPRMRGDYLRTLNNWESVFPDAQIFIGFSDDIDRHPHRFLAQILGFLGVSTNIERLGLDLTARVNPGSADLPRGLPPEIAGALASSYISDLQALADRFGGHALEWLDSARRLAGTDEPAGSNRAAMPQAARPLFGSPSGE